MTTSLASANRSSCLRVRTVATFACALLSGALQAQAVCPFNWQTGDGAPGTNGVVRAMVEYDDGSGPALYAGGSFTVTDNMSVNNIVKWDGTSWSALGAGCSSTVNALIVFNNELIAAGSFTSAGGVSANNIARWNGTSWSPLGSGLNGSVNALAIYNGELIAAGFFSAAGGNAASNIASWNGTTWSPLGSGVGATCKTLIVYNNQLVAASSGGISGSSVRAWNGSSWSSLGAALSLPFWVNALTIYNGDLIASGSYRASPGQSRVQVAKWNGTSWSDLGSFALCPGNTTFPCSTADAAALVVYNGQLIAGGTFSGSSIPHLASWNGTSWVTFAGGISDGGIKALFVFNGELLVGGNSVRRYDGTSWQYLRHDGFTGALLAFTAYNNELIAGGSFTMAPGGDANYIAKWDGMSWSALDIGMDHSVQALIVFNNELIAGGRFTSAGGTSANYIAKWDGTSWSPLGSGMDGSVSSLTVYNGELIAGGSFTTAGGVSAQKIARWNGTSWSALGSGTSSSVFALTVYDSELIAGGTFTTAGGVGAAGTAKWNGTSWSSLGSGYISSVYALTIYNNELIAAGRYSHQGGVVAFRWNGTSWGALGTGILPSCQFGCNPTPPSDVRALGVYQGTLIAGGEFIDGISQWDGTAWSKLSTGVDSTVYALTSHNNELHAGGNFRATSKTGSSLWAHGTNAPTIAQQPSNRAVCPNSNICFTLTANCADSYRWQKNEIDIFDGGHYSGTGTASLSISLVNSNDLGNYRCVITNSYGVTNSNSVSLSFSGPIITQQPTSESVCPGTSTFFTVTATCNVTNYLWSKDNIDLSDGGHYSGTATSTLIISNIDSNDLGNYQCTITNPTGTTVSSNTSLTFTVDSDSDGTPDCLDNCPNDPNKIDSGQCGCGTPDVDSDGDGTPDCLDGCPNDANKTSPGQCGCDNLDSDTDGDETADCNDGCPNDPGKTEPGFCGCGVPENACPRSIVQWRSMRTHTGLGALGIVLNPATTGNGSSGPTVETRNGGIQKIEVDFDGPLTLANSSNVTVSGYVTVAGVMGGPSPYTPTSVSMVDSDTLQILFNAGVLPDEGCYIVTIGSGAFGETIAGDSNCAVRSLIADVIGNGTVTTSDHLAVKSKLGATVGDFPQYDLNLNGSVTTSDQLFVKGRVTSPAESAFCP